MAKKADIIDDKNFLSDTLSTQVRYVTFSVLGIAWGFFVGNTDFTRKFVDDHHKGLVLLFVLSILTLLADYVQYWSGYLYDAELIKKMEKEKLQEVSYDRTHFLYKLRALCFVAKQLLLMISVGGLLWLLSTVL